MQTSRDPTVDTPTFVDGIGRRLRTVDPTGEEVETLRLCRELSEASSTEPALIERAGRLASFTHASFAQVRRVERFRGALGGLTVVSAPVAGTRLSELLTFAQRKGVPPNFDAALYLLEQVAAAMTALHRHSRDLSHGALGPERIVVRPDGHPVIVEHLLAPAIGRLGMPRAALWTQFRVPAPAVAGSARLDQMTDILQLGVLALALILGRPIRREEFPQKLQELLTEASTPGVLGPRPAIARSLHGWILRTLQFESRSAFRTMGDAAAALDALVAEQPRHKISPTAVVAYAAVCMAPGEGTRPQPGPAVSLEPIVLRDTEPAKPEPDRSDTTRVFRLPRPKPGPVRPRVEHARPHAKRHEPRGQSTPVPPRAATEAVGEQGDHASFLVRAVTRAVRGSIQQVSRLDWSSVRRGVRVALVSLGLVALFGATYLGARGYLGLPSFIGGRGTLVVESQPSGADLFVDGFPSGQTPATLQLRAGEHTLAVRAGKRTTLVPVVVVSGARRVERIEIRPRRATPARPPAPAGVGPAASPAAAAASSSAVTGK
jgi:hypothetical protein